jgi:hypothetical protein
VGNRQFIHEMSLCCSRTIATVTHTGIQAVIQLCGYREILHGIFRAYHIHVALFMNAAFMLLSPRSCCDSKKQNAAIGRLCTAFSDHDAFMRTDVVKQHARVNMMFALSRAAHSIGFKSASPAQNARLLFGQSDMP